MKRFIKASKYRNTADKNLRYFDPSGKEASLQFYL